LSIGPYSGRKYLEGTFYCVEFLPSKRSGHSAFCNCFPVIPNVFLKLISAGALYSVMPLDQGFPQK
jgi:hypothetical protein